jgi:predicted RNA polymerase sigma factor
MNFPVQVRQVMSAPAVAEPAVRAIRLTRMLHRLLPEDTEVTGLLALMLLTDVTIYPATV